MKGEVKKSKKEWQKMDSKLSIEILVKGIKILELAFDHKEMSSKRTELFHDYLQKNFTDKQFITVVNEIINYEDRFPTISVFNRIHDEKFGLKT